MNKQFDIEKTFNPQEYLYFYRDILTDERLKKEIFFLVEHAELDRPLDILDLACGHGRHANALAHLGHRVKGLDITEGFLEIARKEASNLGVEVDYIHEDMRLLKDINSFDRIFSLFTAIGYFTEEENEGIFNKIFQALKPNGIFCFDSHNRDSFITYSLPSNVTERDGNILIDQPVFDTLTGYCETRRTVIFNGIVKSFDFRIRLYNPTELAKLFKKIGFSSISFYDNWESKPLSSKSKRMVVVARK